MIETQEVVDVVANSIPEADVPIIFEIAKKAIEAMNLQPVITDEAFAALTPHERFIEMITPRICSFKMTEELECIFIRFVGDETPIATVVFFPIEAVWSFLDTARKYFRDSREEDIEKLALKKAVDMFCLMLRNLYPRVLATMQSITEETINEWYRQEHESYREYCSRQGIVVPNKEPAIKKARQEILTDYRKDVGNVWQGEQKRFENYQKMRLAEEYEKLYEHWDRISLLFRNKKDWSLVSKMPGFEDTPDDLLEELKGSHHRGMSLKALEHAARRVGIINSDCKDPSILETRRSGIQATGYSETALYKYLDEGKKIIESVRVQHAIESTPQEQKQLAE